MKGGDIDMKNKLAKILAVILIISYIAGVAQSTALTVYAAEPDTYTLDNGYVTVTVSGRNGGFYVDTREGSKLVKSDNNKRLLYHSGEFDTSFTSFQVTYHDDGNKIKEYIFGGNYSFLGLGGNDLTTVQDASGITSTWTVDGLTFTQRIQLANTGANEHGMVVLNYSVESARTDTVSVRQRLLLDTALGEKDYAVYEIMDQNNLMRRVESEQVIQTENVTDPVRDFIPLAFFGYDDPNAPGIVAYTVNSASALPYSVAFAHWNNIAATAFDFVPDPALYFTSKNNIKYQTADSACALYYDMGTVTAGDKGKSIMTNYGVYSNREVEESGKVAMNVVSPTALELSADKKSYLKTDPSVPGDATFGIQAQIENFLSDDPENKPKDYERVTVVLYPANGITPLDNSGRELTPAPSYSNPFSIDIIDFRAGETQTVNFLFKADTGDATAYRKVEMRVFDTSSDRLGSGDGLVQENLIGTHSFYVLCPGGDGTLPKVTFTGKKPEILYYKGTRHVYITGTNLEMLENKSLYELWAYNAADERIRYKIKPENILFTERNKIDAVLDEEMAPGTYRLKFELTQEFAETLGCERTLTAPALSLVISGDEKYQKPHYGVLAVVQEGTGLNARYYIRSYLNEAEFNRSKASYKEVLVTLRGDFTMDDDGHGSYIYKAMSGKKGFNTVTVNNCIDFCEGVVSVYYHYDNGAAESVYVDFDGTLYTSVEGTGIWKGKAALTEIKNGEEYGLIPYNKNGQRLASFTEKTITLIWPDVYGIHQTLSGMIFKLTYGALGRMYDTGVQKVHDLDPDTPVLGETIAFSASMDLGFLIPKSQKAKDAEGRAIHAGTELYWISQNPTGELRGLWNHYMNETKKQKSQTGKEFTKGQASVMVDDILFGCGEGFLGVNFNVGLALPAYVDSMPSIEGTLAVNTIGNWSVGVKGKCRFTTITLEAELKLKSYKNIPIPDKLYLYVEGFEPGINVDGFGVFWITGGGGGFDNLYDTIFLTDSVPPLKLLLSMSFDIVKVMSARADMYLGLRGIGLSVRNVKLKMTDIVVLNSLKLQLDWYPDIYLMAALDAYFYYGTIRGQGYLVVIQNDQYPNGFFEGFIRGTLMVPSAIPIIGGMEVGQVDFGLSSVRIWGAATVLKSIGISVVYYWGGDVSVGFGKDANAKPTFPELLGCEDIPVYYDQETGRTLYMRVGDNLSLAAPTLIEDPAMPRLLDGGLPTVPTVRSDADLVKHTVFVPADGKKYIYTVSFNVPKVEAGTDEQDLQASLESARAAAAAFTIRDNDTKAAFPIELYHPDPDGSGPLTDNLDTANANVTYDITTETATLAVTLTRPEDFGREWEILTPGTPANIVLLEVGSLPGISSLNIDTFTPGTPGAPGSPDIPAVITASWSGTGLDELDSVSFFLTKDPTGADAGIPIGTLTAAADITQGGGNTDGSGGFSLPADLPSGEYYLRAVYSKEGSVNGAVVSPGTITHSNDRQPADPSGVIAANGGDLTLDVTLEGSTGASDADGYLASVYEVNSQGGLDATDIIGMTFDRDEQGNLPPISVGGSYQAADSEGKPVVDAEGNPVMRGLAAGKTYKVGITAFNYVDADGDGLYDGVVYGNEVLSDGVLLKAAIPPVIEISTDVPFVIVTRQVWQQKLDGNGNTVTDANGDPVVIRTNVTEDVFRTQDIVFNASSDVDISGVWQVDNFNVSGDFTGVRGFDIPLAGLAEGTHTLEISGTDEDGDSFRRTRVFTVDTQAPNLLLSSPVDGSFFGENGRLTIGGAADKDAVFTISVDGNIPAGLDSKTLDQLGASFDDSGVFSLDITVDPGVASHHLTIIAADAAGNTNSVSLTLQNAGLSNISRLSLLSNGIEYTNQNISLNPSGSTAAIMELKAMTASGRSFAINDSGLVHWDVGTVSGSAAISDSGELLVSPGSLGFVTGGLKVAEGGSMTASATFGAEIYSEGYGYSTLTLGATVGGTASGGGRFREGSSVEITALPESGYRFTGWTVQGSTAVTIANRFSARTTVTIPVDDVTIIANFEHISGGGTGTDTGGGKAAEPNKADDAPLPPVTASAGDKVSINLPEGVDGSNITVCYIDNGIERIVPWSAVIDGKLNFIAPVDGKYYFRKTEADFSDIKNHWAKKYIEFAYGHSLFNGIGGGLFGPDMKMSRSMFVTVLGRLHGIDPAAYGGSSFSDVRAGSWYSPYVQWASKNNIVMGSGGRFEPDREITRQEMCVILKRYIEYAGLNLREYTEAAGFLDEDKVSSWAADAVGYAHRTGLMTGDSKNRFNPQVPAARAEVATVFKRLIEKVLESL